MCNTGTAKPYWTICRHINTVASQSNHELINLRTSQLTKSYF